VQSSINSAEHLIGVNGFYVAGLKVVEPASDLSFPRFRSVRVSGTV
jgi:hypothetical protein